ncbi:MAG: GH25 family lysozyme [Clostridium sp.]
MKGIDVSNNNGGIDFLKVKNTGIEVIIIKATEGVDWIDPYLEKHYNGACGKGFSIGFYHFMSEKTNPSKQAEDFYNAIKDKEYNVLPCLDIETNNYGRTPKEITDRCLEFLRRFKELSGLDCMIYTGGYFGRDNLDSRIKNYKAWIAHYGVETPMDTGFSNVVGHQYTENGYAEGVGKVDMNNFTEGIFIEKTNISINNTNSSINKNVDWLFEYLESWDWKAWVMELQSECNAQGFSNQPVDGICGAKTLTGCPTLKIGAKGNITKLLQRILKAYGIANLKIDGVFGEETKKAVVAYQKLKGLVADGIVGPNTWRALLGL